MLPKAFWHQFGSSIQYSVIVCYLEQVFFKLEPEHTEQFHEMNYYSHLYHILATAIWILTWLYHMGGSPDDVSEEPVT